QTYETAVERGQSAVLHEELLRGVHMLSVAHVPPGADIEVIAQWAMTVSLVGEGGTLRIPLTVGDIYGRSALPEFDALVHGGPMQAAELAVRCADGEVELVGGHLEKGRAFVPLNAPIDLRIAVWSPRVLTGRAADGREVTLLVEWPPARDRAIDVAILVDRSGSMNERCSASGRTTKHDAVIEGLAAMAGHLGERDAVDLWEFDETLSHVGSTREIPRAARASDAVHQTSQARLIALADRLTPPNGGTEISQALAGLVQQSTMRDILLITDGKSHALPVQALAGAGRRITVVLVGEDSLEARVGYLAALTGGDIFVAAGAGLRDAMVAALATVRRPHEVPVLTAGFPQRIWAHRGGAMLTAEWRPAAAPIVDEPVEGRAVAAFAAALTLPCLESGPATALAVAEGLVTHLTSLVLVDEDGAVRNEIPAVRKVALPTPRTFSFPVAAVAAPAAAVRREAPLHRTKSVGVSRSAPATAGQPSMPRSDAVIMRTISAAEREARTRALLEARRDAEESSRRRASEEVRMSAAEMAAPPRRSSVDPVPLLDLSAIGRTIDWDRAPNDLLVGDLSRLDRRTARLIENAAALPELTAYARSLGISPVTLVVALLAHAAKGASRSALRIANALLGAAHPANVERVKAMLCLS
ncbi:MAG: VWA domain-containing protein, partial [Reyranella sp.]|nr:VWA domain-containing protein [Reyranella sp.]